MFLYLVQHAEGKREEEDPVRDLTEKGRKDIENVAHHLKRLNVQVKQILHSGKTRAQSTANVLARHLKPPAESQKLRGWRRWMTPRSGRVVSRKWMRTSCW